MGVKALLQLANFALGPDATLNTETQKAKWAAIEDGDHNASIKTHIEKTVERVRTTPRPPP